MPEEKNTIDLRILDTDFSIKAGESEEYIREIASSVNDELMKVKSNNPFTNHIRIAILGCMNITERLFEAQKDVASAEKRQAEESNNIALVKQELERAQNDIETVKNDKYELIEEQKKLQGQLDEHVELLNQYREHLKQEKTKGEDQVKRILDLQNQLFEKELELQKVLNSDPSATLEDEAAEEETTESQEKDA